METKRLQTHGQTMTPPRPRASRAEYQKERRRLLHDLYFPSVEEKARLQALAAVEGFGHDFNAWLLLKLYASLSGNVYPAGYVEGIQADLERVRGWLESSREDAASSAAEVKALRARLEVLLVMVSELPAGGEIVARFLVEGQGVRL